MVELTAVRTAETLGLLCLLCIVAPSLPAAQLRLVNVDGKTIAPLIAVDGTAYLIERDGERVPASKQSTWMIEGDLRAHAHLARWSPNYRISRLPENTARAHPSIAAAASLSLLHQSVGIDRGSRGGQPLWAEWPESRDSTPIVVAAWWVHGAITQVVVAPLGPGADDRLFNVDLSFWLSADEAHGQPVVFLWRGGEFVTAKPMFEDGPTAEAAVAVWLDDDARLAAAISAGAHLGGSARTGMNLGGIAAEAGSLSVLRRLHAMRPRLLFEKDRHGRSALNYAARNDRREVIEWLMSVPGTRAAFKSHLDAVFLDVASGGHTDLVTDLLKRFAPVDPSRLPENVVREALWRGHPETVRALQAAGAGWFISADDAGVLLCDLLREERWICAELVLAHPTNGSFEAHGLSTLDWAAARGSADLATALIRAKADPKRVDDRGITPLMRAAQAGNVEFGRVLLDHGVNPRAASKDQVQALHLAATANSEPFVQLLLERGANVDASTLSGLTALDIALLLGAGDAARALSAAGARIDLGSPRAHRMLESALCNDVPEPIEAAIADGWSIDALLSGDWPPLCLARVFRATRCEAVLLAAGADAQAPQPCPLVPPSEIDEPLQVLASSAPLDPRRPEEMAPAQTVMVDFIIGPDGIPSFPRIKSTPDPRLGTAALDALLKWRFAPPLDAGAPVAVRALLPFSFPARADRVIDANALSQPPKILKATKPAYPRGVDDVGAEVSVTVSVTVGILGQVLEARIIRATHEGFDEAAVACIKEWRFKAGELQGMAVTSRLQVAVVFDRPRRR